MNSSSKRTPRDDRARDRQRPFAGSTNGRLMIVAALLAMLGACGEGVGSAKFTTWGEAYIEDQIASDPTGEEGFIDGWTVHYDRFLVTFHAIQIAEGDAVAASWDGSKLVDQAQPGRKDLVTFDGLAARHYNRVSYQIKPPTASTELVGATEADRAMMIDEGYSVYVAGTASKGTITKRFHWGFAISTAYRLCQQPAASGQALDGIVVTDGGTDITELTIHGDHPYYDRLRASPDPAIATVLRFDEKAAADTNDDGEVTLEELNAAPIDVLKYDPSGFDVTTLGGFMTALARTIGHFRGEGECVVVPL